MDNFNEQATEQGKIPAEKLVELEKQLDKVPQHDIGGAVREVKQAIDYVLHESATGDDTPEKYGEVKSQLYELNRMLEEVKAFKEKLEL